MKRNDIGLHANSIVIRLGDARILRRHANGTAARISGIGRALRARRLGNHESARAIAKIDELHQIEARLDKRIAAANAAIGSARGNEGRGVGGPHDDIVDALAVHNKVSPHIVQRFGVKPRRRKRLNRISEQRPLRHRNAQRARFSVVRDGFLDFLER